MSVERLTLDANILVYAQDPGDPIRQRVARKVIEHALERDCVITLQALAEFFSVATQKGMLPYDQAAEQVSIWQSLFPVVVAKGTTLGRAIRAVTEHRLNFWDAMLWATAKEAGASILVTEDFSPGRTIDGIRIASPFDDSGSALIRA